MKKRTLKRQANIIRGVDIYNKKPYYKKRYVNNRTNSLAEVKRIYLFLIGNMRGFTAFEKSLKEKFPKTKKCRGKNIEWHFKVDRKRPIHRSFFIT